MKDTEHRTRKKNTDGDVAISTSLIQSELHRAKVNRCKRGLNAAGSLGFGMAPRKSVHHHWHIFVDFKRFPPKTKKTEAE